MPRHSATFELGLPVAAVRSVCDRALAQLTTVETWQAIPDGGMRCVVKRGFGLFTNPVTVDVEVRPTRAGSEVRLDGSSLGWGPIQDSNVKRNLQEMREGIEQAARAVPVERIPPVPPAPAIAGPLPTLPQPAPDHADRRIFVSYRREDSADVTGRICDALEREFSASSIFRDVDSIPLGVDFREHLDTAVQRCSVVLAVIGREWAGEGDVGRRIDDAQDFVRIEIESAMKRQIPVIPLLVNRASMPRAEDLPASIASLAYRQSLAIRHDPDFRADVARLCQDLRRYFEGEDLRAKRS